VKKNRLRKLLAEACEQSRQPLLEHVTANKSWNRWRITAKVPKDSKIPDMTGTF
jgi:16S rRNA U1498 N3-methylase RsmE